MAVIFHAANATVTPASTTHTGSPNKYLIVSAPQSGVVEYVKIGPPSSLKGGNSVKPLITNGSLHPQGLAVDQMRKRLLVADPDSKAIYGYPLIITHSAGLSVGPQMVVASDVEARWVAVDGLGNVFFSDEPQNKIMKIPTNVVTAGNTSALTAFDGATLVHVSAPGGVAVDGFNTFWVNKHTGTQAGSVVRGAEVPGGGSTSGETVSALELSKNSDKSYGVCLAFSNVYYTQPERVIYGVKKSGGTPVTISDRLINPRGCAWDGENTIYVADRGAGAVYSFPGNTQHLSMVEVTKSVEVADAFGVAVFSGAVTSKAATFLLLIGLVVARQG